ncbi:MarR family protein [mine drainage metagenome]|uniref:MarR family protein n=1 Tax=mine drainage metagenome TaxID=410659 RepID=A0A1J5SJX4_9ZZZZ
MTTPPLPSETAAALATGLRALVGRLKRRLRAQSGGDDLPAAQIYALLRLESDGAATMSQLARAEGMRPQSMAAILSPLQAAGHVRAAPDPGDGRQILWALTDSCRQWLAERRAARQDWLTRAIEARFTPEEQARLAEAVLLLRRLADD